MPKEPCTHAWPVFPAQLKPGLPELVLSKHRNLLHCGCGSFKFSRFVRIGRPFEMSRLELLGITWVASNYARTTVIHRWNTPKRTDHSCRCFTCVSCPIVLTLDICTQANSQIWQGRIRIRNFLTWLKNSCRTNVGMKKINQMKPTSSLNIGWWDSHHMEMKNVSGFCFLCLFVQAFGQMLVGMSPPPPPPIGNWQRDVGKSLITVSVLCTQLECFRSRGIVPFSPHLNAEQWKVLPWRMQDVSFDCFLEIQTELYLF